MKLDQKILQGIIFANLSSNLLNPGIFEDNENNL